MSSDKTNAVAAPPPSEEKTCPACGGRFRCLAAQGGCWCEEVKLSSETVADLRSRFSGCLCPRCLSLAAESRAR